MAGIETVVEATNGKLIPHPDHGDLRREIEQIRKVARAIPGLIPQERKSAIAPIVTFLQERLEGQVAELAAADPRDWARLQELLYALRALIESHLTREHDLYLRLLFRDE